ncbi:MAG: NAD(P)H-dependent oxidoreductase [Cyclobacteriaceae bacterium]
MKKIIAFGASSSSTSINQQLAVWAASHLEGVEATVLDLNDFEMPIFSIDRETAGGIHEKARQFKAHIESADGIIISFAEHNGSYSSAFKNIFDWMSRIGQPIWSDKPMFLMGTSPGGRGAKSVLGTAVNDFPHRGGKVVASFSLPSFGQNFDGVEGIVNEELKQEFRTQSQKFLEAIM